MEETSSFPSSVSAVEGRKTSPQAARMSTTLLYTEVLELSSRHCRAQHQTFLSDNICIIHSCPIFGVKCPILILLAGPLHSASLAPLQSSAPDCSPSKCRTWVHSDPTVSPLLQAGPHNSPLHTCSQWLPWGPWPSRLHLFCVLDSGIFHGKSLNGAPRILSSSYLL